MSMWGKTLQELLQYPTQVVLLMQGLFNLAMSHWLYNRRRKLALLQSKLPLKLASKAIAVVLSRSHRKSLFTTRLHALQQVLRGICTQKRAQS